MKLTAEQSEECRRLFAEGWTIEGLASHFMCSTQSIRRRVDARYAEARRRYENAQRKREAGPAAEERRIAEKHATKSDRLARLAEIPPDTRSLTARICGDPIPGRSALDRRARA